MCEYAVLPVPVLPVAAALVADYAADAARVLVEDLSARWGRPVVGRRFGQVQRYHFQADGAAEMAADLGGLQSGGPWLLRQVRLYDPAGPDRPLAVCAQVLVPDRMPAPVLAAIEDGSDEPADWLLSRHGVSWSAQLLTAGSHVAPVEAASIDLSWLGPDAVLIELARRAYIGGRPVATLIDQIPLLADPPALASAAHGERQAMNTEASHG